VADVKIGDSWRTMLIFGQGSGGTFYQSLDVTLDGMNATVGPASDAIDSVLAFFANPARVTLQWSFPRLSSFDATIGADGDVAASASAIEKTVGETWSDPVVGQIDSAASPYTVVVGSGFLKYTMQQQANRGGAIAGTTLYVLNAATGAVITSQAVGSDALGENVDDCRAANNCTRVKNALQADPVASGLGDSRFMTKVYIGDLDGRVWRFDLALDVANVPKFKTSAPTKLFDATAAHPLFSTLATVNAGTQQYLFQGTGSDLLPSNGVSQNYKLLALLDTGTSATKTAEVLLDKVDGTGGDEKVTAFPAVAGDVVFFATTSAKPTIYCGPNADANLYAITFVGGPAYDTNGDAKLSGADSIKVRTTVGARANAPFVVDQHLAFAAGNKIEMFGDPQDYNNGVGQAGLRVLSWREQR
jgi:Tfp pilus tip-associated adhesin PilY1